MAKFALACSRSLITTWRDAFMQAPAMQSWSSTYAPWWKKKRPAITSASPDLRSPRAAWSISAVEFSRTGHICLFKIMGYAEIRNSYGSQNLQQTDYRVDRAQGPARGCKA